MGREARLRFWHPFATGLLQERYILRGAKSGSDDVLFILLISFATSCMATSILHEAKGDRFAQNGSTYSASVQFHGLTPRHLYVQQSDQML
jgi:hypothetical protein